MHLYVDSFDEAKYEGNEDASPKKEELLQTIKNFLHTASSLKIVISCRRCYELEEDLFFPVLKGVPLKKKNLFSNNILFLFNYLIQLIKIIIHLS